MGNNRFPIDEAQLVGLFMESVFYGWSPCIFLVTFFGCLRVLTMAEGRFKSWSNIHYKMLLAALLMFIFASLDVAFHLRHNLVAFIEFTGDPIDEFSNTSNWINVMGMACYVAQTFIGDSILLYRCWIIHSRNWLVILVPALFWLAGTVCGVLTIYTEISLQNNASLLNASDLVPFITSMLTLTLVTNILTTSLMVFRIHSIRRRLKHRSTMSTYAPLKNVTRLLIESGLMYTSTIIILFILYMLSDNGQYGVSNAVVQIIGITFNLIITRVDRGEATQPTTAQAVPSRTNISLPLHTISIQTTVSQFSDPVSMPPKVIVSNTGYSPSYAQSEHSSIKEDGEHLRVR